MVGRLVLDWSGSTQSAFQHDIEGGPTAPGDRPVSAWSEMVRCTSVQPCVATQLVCHILQPRIDAANPRKVLSFPDP